MNKKLSARNAAEQRTKADNQQVSPACIKPNVSGCRVRPILFSGEMVRAILEGRKTQTRRKIKPKDEPFLQDEKYIIELNKTWGWVVKREIMSRPTRWEILQQFKCPYGKIGDILWVRETWNCISYLNPNTEYKYFYRADGDEFSKWKPSIFMPKSACRIFLKITDIRVEKLKSISKDDAINEGINPEVTGDDLYENYDKVGYRWIKAKDSFKSLWQKINGNWESNPFVWVIKFERCERPLDSH